MDVRWTCTHGVGRRALVIDGAEPGSCSCLDEPGLAHVLMRLCLAGCGRLQVLYSTYMVQWLEDKIKADPFFGRSRVRFRVPPWVSKTIARDHLAKHRRRPCELRGVV